MTRFSEKFLTALPLLLAFLLVGWLMWPASEPVLAYGLATMAFAALLALAIMACIRRLRARKTPPALPVLGILGLLLLGGLYLAGLVWMTQPTWLPARSWYDFLQNNSVIERQVDPALVKVETWEILGDARPVLFMHPGAGGVTSVVYPVMVRPGTVLLTAVALAPEAWDAEGDGVDFTIYVEDDAGTHVLESRYIDPKHAQEDRRWTPLTVDLSPYAGELVRIIFTVKSGPAGDMRFDWSGWAEPRLVEPAWP